MPFVSCQPTMPATAVSVQPACSGMPPLGVGVGLAAHCALPVQVISESGHECLQQSVRWNLFTRDPLQEIRKLAAQGAHQRNGLERHELMRLHSLWLAAGGECISPESPVDALVRGEQVVRGGTLLRSELWGEIDPLRLNQGLSAYRDGAGLVELARDLAVTTACLTLDIQRLPAKIANTMEKKKTLLMREQGWKKLSIDWRRARYLSRILKETSFRETSYGEAGYDRFAREFFLGNAGKAYEVASALLTPEQFAALAWGKVKQIRVQDQKRIRDALLSGSYQGEAGYDCFAEDFFLGYAGKAHQVASALLTPEQFAALAWGKTKRVRTQDQKAVREALLSGSYQEEAGYDRFAEEFFRGNALKAYQVASALLTREQFAALAWGKVKLISVQDQKQIREALLSWSYQGEVGYDRFAKEFFLGDAQKAYQVASALLTREQFAALAWGKVKPIRLQDQKRIREALLSGSYQEQAGYDCFAEEFFRGNAQKAHQVASALLTPEQFAALAWGKMKLIRVQDQKTIREALLSGSYHGEAGYERFAQERFLGDAQKTYQVASALLTREQFGALAWGKMKPIRVQDQKRLRDVLLSGSYQGEAGYDRFAQDFFLGYAGKAYHVASAILTREQFAALAWGKMKLIRVQDQKRVREALESGVYNGRAGRMRFVRNHFGPLGGKSIAGAYSKAFVVASALLQHAPETFRSMEWRSTDALTPEEEASILSAFEST